MASPMHRRGALWWSLIPSQGAVFSFACPGSLLSAVRYRFQSGQGRSWSAWHAGPRSVGRMTIRRRTSISPTVLRWRRH